MRVSPRKLLLLLLGLLVLGFLVYRSSAMLHLGDFSGAKLLQTARHASPGLLIVAVIAIYLCYALRALRWGVFQGNIGSANFQNIYAMTLAGFSAVFLLGRAGEPVRPLLLARKEKIPVADTFGIWVLERLFDTASTAVITIVGLLVYSAHPHSGDVSAALEKAATTTGAILALGVAAAIGFLVYLRLHGSAMLERRLERWRTGHGWRASVARIILGFIRGIQTIRGWGELVLAAFYSAAHWILVLAIYYVISQAFGGQLARLSWSDTMLLLAFTLVGSAVQLPGVGGGSQVACFLAYTTIFGVEKEPAAAAAIVLWLVTFAACSLAGVPLLIREGLSLGDLQKMAHQETAGLGPVVTGSVASSPSRGETIE
jgi:glycosyltransferase 2 family protein